MHQVILECLQKNKLEVNWTPLSPSQNNVKVSFRVKSVLVYSTKLLWRSVRQQFAINLKLLLSVFVVPCSFLFKFLLFKKMS